MDPEGFLDVAAAIDHEDIDYMETGEAGGDARGGNSSGGAGEGMSGGGVDLVVGMEIPGGSSSGGLNLGMCGGTGGGAGSSGGGGGGNASPGNGMMLGGHEGCGRGAVGVSQNTGGGPVAVGNMIMAKGRVPTVRGSESRVMVQPVQPALQEQIARLTSPRPSENLDPTLIHRMPPEGECPGCGVG